MGRKGLLSTIILLLSILRIEAQSSFEFVQNKGQWDNRIQFKGEFYSGAFFLQQKGFTVLLNNPQDLAQLSGHGVTANEKTVGKGKTGRKGNKNMDVIPITGDNRNHSPQKNGILRSHAYVVEFAGANEKAEVIPEKALPSYNNYFIGNDPSKWTSNVMIYQAILYKNIYPNIDVRYYSDAGRLKYDIIVHPGGDPRNIIMKYTGADKLSIRNDELIIKTSVGDVKEMYPYTFQPDDIKGRKEISCKYMITGNTVSFRISDYLKSAPLIIDPSLIFASFTGSSSDQYGFTATPGPDGSLYSGGIVFGSGFPTTPGAFQRSFAGGSGDRGIDIGIMKFSPNGSQRLYATYIGGNNDEYPHSLVCDPQGNLVVMGRSYSANYPGTVPIGGKRDSANSNIVVTKLNSSGTNIIGSLIIGGSGNDGVNIKDLQRGGDHGGESLVRNYGDDSRSEVILDGSNNIYVAAQTRSADFPIIGNVFQKTAGGNSANGVLSQDGVVMKINPDCTAIIWSSYLGGTQDDGAFVLELDPLTHNIYVGGGTLSSVFPGNKTGTVGPNFNGGAVDTPDGFVAIISNDGSALIKSTYIGTNKLEVIYGLKFDKKGFPYIMGITRAGAAWPIKNAAYSKTGSSQFIAKLKPDLSDYVYSTVFGTGSPKPNMSPVAFLVDRCENVYISGWGGWINRSSEKDPYDMAGVAGMDITSDAISKTTDNHDFYFAVIEKNASKLLYGTFFGQNGGVGEHVDGGTSRYDQQGVIYQAICANCSGGARFPTTPGVIGPVNGALPGGCNLAAVKISFNFAGVASGPKSFYNGAPDSMGCAPFTVQLRDTVRNGKTFEWDLDGDGITDTITSNFELTHTFDEVRVYRIRQIAVDSATCNERDTAYINIRVRNDEAYLKWDYQKQLPCENLTYKFTNLSSLSAPAANKAFGPESFIWDFGDGTRTGPMGTGEVTHTYTTPDTYKVRLILIDTNYCNAPDSSVLELRVSPLVDARIETPKGGCIPYNAVFNNVSLAGKSFIWDFGDGSPRSNEDYPTHLYEAVGTYTVMLIAFDEETCNKIDTSYQTITVSNPPTAAFTYTPVAPEPNTPTVFTNQSNGGILYKWFYGDGDSTLTTTKDTVVHQYNESGRYNACLITYNEYGCSDTACHEIEAKVIPLIDVPNAFTPGKFGKNSRINVAGFGIARMMFRIYNRWGQKVFESNSKEIGWDGTFNGQPQPVDVYAYTLEVEFTDGVKTTKTGDITLIR